MVFLVDYYGPSSKGAAPVRSSTQKPDIRMHFRHFMVLYLWTTYFVKFIALAYPVFYLKYVGYECKLTVNLAFHYFFKKIFKKIVCFSIRVATMYFKELFRNKTMSAWKKVKSKSWPWWFAMTGTFLLRYWPE